MRRTQHHPRALHALRARIAAHAGPRPLGRVLSREDGAALMLTLITIVVIAGLSLLLLGALINQFIPLYTAEKRTQTVYAAEAGLQAGLAELRSHNRVATNGNTYGDPGSLPCSANADPDGVTRYYGALEGSLDAGGADASGLGYRITITYHSDDPVGKGQAWIDNPANQIHCGLSPLNQPAYAVVTATGTGDGIADFDEAVGNRTVSAIYEFRLTNVNIPGGILWVSGGTQCLKAQSAAANSAIQFVSKSQCDDPANAALVNWVYDKKWHLVLASTINVTGVTPLCITNPDTTRSDIQARLANCGPGGSNKSDVGQRWQWNASWTWNGVKCQGAVSASCTLQNNANSKPYNKSNVLWIGTTTTQYDPAPSVGAGAASYLTKQLVNYKEFGRCADVTHADINKTFMIVYPCKQDATGNNAFDWNHKWNYTEPARNYSTGVVPTMCADSDDAACKRGPQQITVVPGSTYCLTVASTSGDSELIFKNCDGSAKQRFTRYTQVPDQAKSWTVQDAYGRCLSADFTDKFESNWSKLKMKACGSGALEQKWNAPPQSSSSSFGSFREVSE